MAPGENDAPEGATEAAPAGLAVRGERFPGRGLPEGGVRPERFPGRGAPAVVVPPELAAEELAAVREGFAALTDLYRALHEELRGLRADLFHIMRGDETPGGEK